MSNIFWKPKTGCAYLDDTSQTWYIVHEIGFTLPYSVGAV